MKRRISAFMLIITILSTLCGVTVCAVEPRYSYTTTALYRQELSILIQQEDSRFMLKGFLTQILIPMLWMSH